jgi:hypothetical protein
MGELEETVAGHPYGSYFIPLILQCGKYPFLVITVPHLHLQRNPDHVEGEIARSALLLNPDDNAVLPGKKGEEGRKRLRTLRKLDDALQEPAGLKKALPQDLLKEDGIDIPSSHHQDDLLPGLEGHLS